MALASRPGIIPARAGFTAPASTQIIAALGSSPLARGLPGEDDADYWQAGIIPARAGFTGPGLPLTVDKLGSSPLARGLLIALPDGGTKAGIIPARAGFTPRTPRRGCPCADHPRSRGVYLLLQIARAGLLLDHPRSRGVYG